MTPPTDRMGAEELERLEAHISELQSDRAFAQRQVDASVHGEALATGRKADPKMDAYNAKYWQSEIERNASRAEIFRRKVAALDTALTAIADLKASRAEVERLRGGLDWYAQQAEGCRKVTLEGDTARQALDRDGGKRARALLSRLQPTDAEGGV